MRKIRIHTVQPLVVGETITLESGPARHLVKVLRQRVGNRIALFNGDGAEYFAEIRTASGQDTCSAVILERSQPATESALATTLVQAIGRGDRMDWCIQKAVELGVYVIQPVFTERTEVRLAGSRAAKRLSHWQQVVVSASEQSGRVLVPEIRPPIDLHEIEPADGLHLYLSPEAATTPEALKAPETGHATIVIGPEGGLSEREAGWLDRAGFTGLQLGPRVLRTETAGPATIAMLQTRFGDWQ